MTPEERLDRIDATLDRAARMYETMVLRQVGIRNLYRQGADRYAELVSRMTEANDRMERQDALLEALMHSQLRTEENLRRWEATHASTEEIVQSLALVVKEFVEAQRKKE